MRLHWHRIKHREALGVWWYLTCRCGARRVTRRFRDGHSPVAQDWPRPKAEATDSGWQT